MKDKQETGSIHQNLADNVVAKECCAEGSSKRVCNA